MKMRLFAKVSLSLLISMGLLYQYLNVQNVATEKRLSIPVIKKDIRLIKEENMHLSYELKRFEDPKNLLMLAKDQRFSHLRSPCENEIIALKPKMEAGQKEKVLLAKLGAP